MHSRTEAWERESPGWFLGGGYVQLLYMIFLEFSEYLKNNLGKTKEKNNLGLVTRKTCLVNYLPLIVPLGS